MSKIKRNEPTNIVPFGKYKGQDVEVMQADQGYVDWFLQQQDMIRKYENIYNVLINFNPDASETPIHNNIQGKFFNELFCASLVSFTDIDSINYVIENSKNSCRSFDYLEININNIEAELKGWDIVFTYSLFANVNFSEDILELHNNLGKILKSDFKHNYDRYDYNKIICNSFNSDCQYFIEIKPSLSDDYPSVLRQIKKNMNFCRLTGRDSIFLVIGEYTGIGVDYDSLKKIFKSSGIEIIKIEDIEHVLHKYNSNKFELCDISKNQNKNGILSMLLNSFSNENEIFKNQQIIDYVNKLNLSLENNKND